MEDAIVGQTSAAQFSWPTFRDGLAHALTEGTAAAYCRSRLRLLHLMFATSDAAGRIRSDWPVLLSTHRSFELVLNWWLPARSTATVDGATAYLLATAREEVLSLSEGFHPGYRDGERAVPEVPKRVVQHFAPRIEVLADDARFVGAIALSLTANDPRVSDTGLDQELKQAVFDALMAELRLAESSDDPREFGRRLRGLFALPGDHPDRLELEAALARISTRHSHLLRTLYDDPNRKGWSASGHDLPKGGHRGRLAADARASLVEELPGLRRYARTPNSGGVAGPPPLPARQFKGRKMR